MVEHAQQNLLAIVLGASRFEDEADEDGVGPRLKASALEIASYLQDPGGLGLFDNQVLFLHDRANFKEVRLDNAGTCRIIQTWISERPDENSRGPFNILLFFVGHGLPKSRGPAKLALATTVKRTPYLDALDPDQLSIALVSAAPQGSRLFLYLDCCFARDVAAAMSFRPREYGQDPGSDLPQPRCDGVVALSASDNDVRAFAPPEDKFTRMTTMFFEALREPTVSLQSYRDVYDKMLAYKDHRRKNGRGTWAELPPSPYLDVLKQAVAGASVDREPVLRAGWRQVLEPFRFPSTGFSEQFTAVVVCREQGSEKLLATVERALSLARSGHRLEQVSGKRIAAERRQIEQNVYKLDVRNAFTDRPTILERLRAVCRADLVVFDTTDEDQSGIEPGGMLLLGVRAVARRGVTICSLDRHPEELFNAPLPYNLQHLNVASHAHDDAAEQLAAKIANGYGELRRDPTYLDLPAFDAIRHLGSDANAYAPVPHYRGPLYLGPFERDYQAHFFRPVEQELKVLLDGIARDEDGRDYKRPRIHRLLDDDRTRMVSQSLYHSIRRHDFCLVDWTQLRANVFFELGVRLASRPSGDVHIVANVDNEPGQHGAARNSGANGLNLRWPSFSARSVEPVLKRQKTDKPSVHVTQLGHVRSLYEIFKPIVYRPHLSSDVRDSCATMLERWERSRGIQHENGVIYDTIAESIQSSPGDALARLVDVLSKRAETTYLRDKDTLRVTILHEDRNTALQTSHLAHSVGLKLAALFLSLPDCVTPRQQHLLQADIQELAQRIRELSSRGDTERDVRSLTASLDLIREATRYGK